MPPPSAKQKAARKKFKQASIEAKKYRKKHPKSTVAQSMSVALRR